MTTNLRQIMMWYFGTDKPTPEMLEDVNVEIESNDLGYVVENTMKIDSMEVFKQ